MRGVSHIVFGAGAAIVVNSFEHYAQPTMTLPFFGVVLANVFGSLGPDMDADESKIRHVTGTAKSDGCLGQWISVIMPKHRGWIHSSTLACALVGMSFWLRWDWAIAFALGWAAHILTDNILGVLKIHNGGLVELLLVAAAGILAWRYW